LKNKNQKSRVFGPGRKEKIMKKKIYVKKHFALLDTNIKGKCERIVTLI